MFFINMSLISLKERKLCIFNSWLHHSWNIDIFHFTCEIKDICIKKIWISSIYSQNKPMNLNVSVRLSAIDFLDWTRILTNTVKPVLSGHPKKDQKLIIKTNYHLMQVKSIAECSKGSILQYFCPSLSYHLSLRSLFCLFLSGRLRQDLLQCNLGWDAESRFISSEPVPFAVTVTIFRAKNTMYFRNSSLTPWNESVHD